MLDNLTKQNKNNENMEVTLKQWQEKVPSCSSHVPPFWHGFGSQKDCSTTETTLQGQKESELLAFTVRNISKVQPEFWDTSPRLLPNLAENDF